MASIIPFFQSRKIETRGFFVCKSGSMEKQQLRAFGEVIQDPTNRRYTPEQRYQKMSRLRNAYLDAIRRSDFHPDYVLCIDMDILRFDAWRGFDLMVKRDDWGSVATMGLCLRRKVNSWHVGPVLIYAGHEFVYYDTLAFESVACERSLWRCGSGWYPHGVIPPHVKLVQTPPQVSMDRWTEVNCAFGPAAFYRWDLIKDFRFDETTLQICHYQITKHVRDKGKKVFVANDIVALYNAP